MVAQTRQLVLLIRSMTCPGKIDWGRESKGRVGGWNSINIKSHFSKSLTSMIDLPIWGVCWNTDEQVHLGACEEINNNITRGGVGVGVTHWVIHQPCLKKSLSAASRLTLVSAERPSCFCLFLPETITDDASIVRAPCLSAELLLGSKCITHSLKPWLGLGPNFLPKSRLTRPSFLQLPPCCCKLQAKIKLFPRSQTGQ